MLYKVFKGLLEIIKKYLVFALIVVSTTVFSQTIAFTSTNPAVSAANISPNSTNNIVYKGSFTFSGGGWGANLSGVTFTPNGTFVSGDFSNIKFWYSTTNNFAGATQTGTTVNPTTPGVQLSINTYNPGFYVGNTYYFWFTVDATSSALDGHSINFNALTTNDFTFSLGTKTGTMYVGGLQTISIAKSISTGTITGYPFCLNSSVSVPFTITGTYNSGNIFTAQLSNASGSFASPVTIGTLTSTTAGTINATIPSNAISGSGYRIRVISSNPAITGSDNGVGFSILNSAFPNAPTTTGANLCIGNSNSVTLSASGAVSGEVYKWYSAATGGSLLKTSTNNTDNTYTTPSINSTTNYWVSIQNAGGCESTRSIVTATMPSAVAEATNAGSDSWVGHVFDGTTFNSYYGSYLTTESFDESFGGDATCFPFTMSGIASSIYTETFSVRYRMNSSKRGLYTVNLGSDDGSRLYVDNILVYNNWNDQAFSNRNNVLLALNGSSSLRYEFYENGGGNRVVFTGLTKLFDNILTQNLNQSVYQGNSGLAVSGDVYGTLPTNISASGTGYQWTYATAPGGARTNISGATSATYTPNTSVAPFNAVGTYYIYRNAILSSTNNVNPNPATQSLESNVMILVVNTPPTITTSVSSISNLDYLVNNGPSAQQSFTVTGTNLLSNITITPPTNFEISTTSGSGFQSTPITLVQSGGNVATTSIYVRLKTSLSTASYSGNITLSSTSAVTKTVALSGAVSLPTYCSMSGNMSYQTSITNVTLNSINQSSAKPSGYSNYTAVSTNLILGSTNNLNIRINTDGGYTCYVRTWIDWNGDGDFEDLGEAYDLGFATSTNNGLTSLCPYSLAIPTTAVIGQTRMRVAVRYNSYPIICTTNFDGEVEDYTVNIINPTLTTGTITGSPFTSGSIVNVPYTVNGAFRTGNIMTAQLSDANGSFASPVNIGTVLATGSGSVSSIIPANTAPGVGYRIRVVASNPSVTANDNGSDIIVLSNGVFATPASISGFTYKQNLGPSGVDSITVGGFGLTANLRVEIKRGNFELSTSKSNFSGLSVINLSVNNGLVNATKIYVRMKSGLSVGSITDSIKVSSTSYSDKYVSLGGVVTTSPNITVNPTSLSLGTYNYGGGPTAAQNFTVTASRLSGSVTITPPAGFEIKLSTASTYQSTALTLSADYPAVSPDSLLIKTINVRMKSGNGAGVHTENIIVSSSGATSKNVVVTGTVNPVASILNSNSYLGAFVYTVNQGPSKIQGFKLEVFNLAANSTVTLTPPVLAYYEISNSRSGTFQTSPLAFTNQSGTFSDSIFVRLKAGLAVGSYINQALTITASGAVTKSVGLNGSVVNTATISTNTNSLTGFGYQFYNGTPTGILHGGPSSSQTFVVSGVQVSSTVTLTASTNFEISTNNTTFSNSLNLTSQSNILYPTTIYVRLKSSLAVGTYTGTVSISGGATKTVNLVNAKVYESPVISTTSGGDYCLGSSITLNSSGAAVENQYWEGPNGFYSLSANPLLTNSATAALSGDYVVTGNVTVGGNLIYNGGFESGFVGFGSSYNYRDSTYVSASPAYGPLYGEGDYSVVGIPHNVHVNFTYNGPKSGGRQMVVNGAPNAGVVIWSQAVAVIPNSNYQFTYWEQTVELPNPSQLQLYINGVPAGPVYTASSTKGLWTQFLYNASSGNSNVLNLELINQNTIASGNDFALDDIEMHQVLAAKDTATIAIGSALPVSVSVTASQNPVNSNTPVTFTAVPTNGGTNPTYQWKVNGVVVNGQTSTTYTYTPSNGDVVTCTLTSSLNCVTGNPASNNVVMVVNAVANPNYWIGLFDTDWAKPVNWTDNRVPNPGENVEYATIANYGLAAKKDLHVDNIRIVGNIINATNKKLVIPAGTQLIVNNNISFSFGVNRDSLIVIKATTPLVNGLVGAANGTLIFNNALNNPVSATVEMYSPASWDLTRPVNQKYNWQFFGIPVQSLPALPTFTGAYVRELIESDADTATHWRSLTDNSVLQSFKGYELCQKAPKIYSFKGKLVNSNFNSGQFVKTTGALYPGQHLFANPYTCAIDIRYIEFGTGVEATAYLYNTGTFTNWRSNPLKNITGLEIIPGQYNSVPKNQAGNYGILSQVPSMGTFMVRIPKLSLSTVNSYIAINYAAVAAQNSDRQRSKILNATKEQTNTVITVEGENGADRMWLMSHESYSKSFDNGFDGLKMAGIALNPQIYSKETDGKYQINSVDNINNSSIVFQAGVDTDYILTVKNDYSALNKYSKIYLHDIVEDKLIDVTFDSISYNFMSKSTVEPVERFRIIAQEQTETKNLIQQTKVYRVNSDIRIQNFSNKTAITNVYDLTGRLIYNRKLSANENIALRVYDNIVYVVKTIIDDKTEVTKLIFD